MKPGDQIVCINDKPLKGVSVIFTPTPLIKGVIYTIKEIEHHIDNTFAYFLEETTVKCCCTGIEIPFNPDRFVPLDEWQQASEAVAKLVEESLI